METKRYSLSDAAEYFYDVCELYDDEDLDPANHVKVLKRAFTSSHCDDFAAVLSEKTGWQVHTATWQIPGYGFGHHAMVKAPNGRYLDVTGWTDEQKLRKRYKIASEIEVLWNEGHLSSPTFDEFDDSHELITVVIENLPYNPYASKKFKAALRANNTTECHVTENNRALRG